MNLPRVGGSPSYWSHLFTFVNKS